MADIGVTKQSDEPDRMTFDVEVREAESSSRHVVTLSRQDYESQSGRFSAPEDFIRRCMEYLLEREPKESILARFDVHDIGRYFPDFHRDVLKAED